MIEQIDRRIRRAVGSIRLAFRGVITLVRAAGAVQLVQADGLAGEGLKDNELFQHYGYTSHPPAGTMAIVLPIGGKTAHGIIIATEHGTYRIKGLAPGETAIYDDQGQKVHITRAGIVVDGAGKPVTVHNTPHVDFDTPQVNMTGALNVIGKITGTGGFAISGGTGITATITGDIATTGTITNNGHRIDNTHTHTGVQAGGDLSGAPA